MKAKLNFLILLIVMTLYVSCQHKEQEEVKKDRVPISSYEYITTYLNLNPKKVISINLLVGYNEQYLDSLGKFTNLKDLLLEHFRLEHLPKCLSKLENLERLYLEGNRLKSLPQYFRKFKNLEVLDLSANSFKTFPEVLLDLESLQEVKLEGPYFKWQWENVFKQLSNIKSLKSLSLGYQNIGSLPNSFGKLKIKTLRINKLYNKLNIKDFELISKIKSLESLRIRTTEIDERGFHYLQNLRKLELIANNINYLYIANLVRLKRLYIKGEQKLNINAVLGVSLPELEELNLNYTLVTFPKFIVNFNALRFLSIKHSKVNKLPQNIGKLQYLEKLDLSYNDLETIPESIKNLKKLKVLNLTGNEKISEKEKLNIRRLLSENVTVYF